MNPTDQRIAIAEACGAKRFKRPWDGRVFLCAEAPSAKWEVTNSHVDVVNSDIPDYLNSLDAMHEAEKLFDGRDMDTRSLWLDNLALVVGWPETKNAAELKFEIQYLTARATAPQRAEAFLRALNLWTEQPPTP